MIPLLPTRQRILCTCMVSAWTWYIHTQHRHRNSPPHPPDSSSSSATTLANCTELVATHPSTIRACSISCLRSWYWLKGERENLWLLATTAVMSVLRPETTGGITTGGTPRPTITENRRNLSTEWLRIWITLCSEQIARMPPEQNSKAILHR